MQSDENGARLSARQMLVESLGFTVAARDPQVKPGVAGAWMITDWLGGEESFAMVGDDLLGMLNEVLEIHGVNRVEGEAIQ